MKTAFVAHVLTWTESESGWGQRPDGYSIHDSTQGASAYIAAHWAREAAYNEKHGITGVPGCYSRPDSSVPRLTAITYEASMALLEAVEAGRYGVRYDKRHDFEPKE